MNAPDAVTPVVDIKTIDAAVKYVQRFTAREFDPTQPPAPHQTNGDAIILGRPVAVTLKDVPSLWTRAARISEQDLRPYVRNLLLGGQNFVITTFAGDAPTMVQFSLEPNS